MTAASYGSITTGSSPPTLRRFSLARIKHALGRQIRLKHIVDIIVLAFLSVAIFLITYLILLTQWATTDVTKIASLTGIFVTATVTVVGWAYRTATLRTGVVNTVASDIYSILRISASLFVVQNLIMMYRANDVKTYTYLIAREEYSFIGKFGLTDLGFLTQNAIKRINGFYITLHAYRDRALMLASWCKDNTIEGGRIKREKVPEFRALICSLIYYAFSCIENGRIALYELLEDDDFRDEAVFITLAQDLRAIAFLLQEADPGYVQDYIKRRLKERFNTSADMAISFTRDREESYLYAGYIGAFERLKDYVRDLDDDLYRGSLVTLFGSHLTQRFGRAFAEEISRI